ncbi:MAG: HNH endonuclease, partial [Candidatus Latescibacterota bacterium]
KDASFENVFEAVLDEFIDRHCPVKKNERRAKRRESATKPSRSGTRSRDIKEQPNRQLAKTKSRGGTDIMLTSRSRNRPRGRRRDNKSINGSRRVPAKTRDAIHERDNGRCTYIGTNGKRCRSTHRLHVDHIVPFARGGTNAKSNLRLLCAKHNNLEANRVYGSTKINAHARRE